MSQRIVCPYCGGAVPANRNLCPHCLRALPASDAAPSTAGLERPTAPPSAPAQPTAQPPPPRQPAGWQTPAAGPHGAYPSTPYQPPCGYPPGAPPPRPPRDDTLAIVGLILSSLGIMSCCCLGILCPIGLVLSIISHSRHRSGLSLAGLIVGGIGTLGFVTFTALGLFLSSYQDELMRKLFHDLPLPPGFPWR